MSTPGNHTGQAECAGRGNGFSLPFSVNADDIYKDAGVSQILGANWVQKCTQIAPNLTDFASPNLP
jgi:hypothetical protein